MTDFFIHNGGPASKDCCNDAYPKAMPGGCCRVAGAGHNTDAFHADKFSLSKIDEDTFQYIKKEILIAGDTMSLHILPRGMFPEAYAFRFLCAVEGLIADVELVGVIGDCNAESVQYDEADVTPLLVGVDFSTYDMSDCNTWEEYPTARLATTFPQPFPQNKMIRLKFTTVPVGGIFAVCNPQCFGFESSLIAYDPCFDDWFAGPCCSGQCCN